MKKLLILFLFVLILPITRAALVIESFQIPSSIEEGDTFQTSLTLRNTGPETIGTSLSPIIATLSSNENCIINSAKIVGVMNPDESKSISWVVTAPTAGGCPIAVSVSDSETYVTEIKSITVLPDQGTQSGGGSPDSGLGEASGGGAAGGATGGGSAGTATTLEPGSISEESEAVEEILITTTMLIEVYKLGAIQNSSNDFVVMFLFYFLILISIGASIFIILTFHKWNVQGGITKKRKTKTSA